MSDLFELSVYNDAVKFYRRKKFHIEACNLMRDGTFKYKLSTSGIKENFSYFKVIKYKNNEVIHSFEVHHNIKLQSFYDEHIYFTSDVSVTKRSGVVTEQQKNGRRHSFIPSESLITFLEVKHMNPFPEVLFSFSGIVLELKPEYIFEKPNMAQGRKKMHLTPTLVFSGIGGKHAEVVADKLQKRYGYNVIRGLFANKGRIYSNATVNTFDA